MDNNDLINEIEKSILLYKHFVCPDYPELNIYAAQYLDVLIKYFNNAKKPYSVVYSDINKLSIVNEKFGKDVGDEVLYTLLHIFSDSLPECPTVRIGGDEFITFINNSTKNDVEKALIMVEMTMIHGSSIAFDVEDSSIGNIEQMIDLAEKKVADQKKHRNKDYSRPIDTKKYNDLYVPEGVSKEQKQKWEILNEKINVLVDNHLRDIRPSNIRFRYTPEHIQKDSKSFVFAFADLLQKVSNGKVETKEMIEEQNIQEDNPENNPYSNMSNKLTLIMHSLFKGEDVDLHSLNDEELITLRDSINTLGRSLTKHPHSGLFNKSYYKLFLADKLSKSKKTYQAIYFSMSGIRPSNTAYGHVATDAKMSKTSKFLIDAISDKLDFNKDAFSFNKNDIFLMDQGGGNFLLLIPNNQKLKLKEIKEIENAVNSMCTNEPDSSLRIASAKKNHLNTRTIPFFVNSMPGNPSTPLEWFRTINQVIRNKLNNTRLLGSPNTSKNLHDSKPFVQLSYRLKSDCNNNKDTIKVDNLDKNICEDTIEVLAKDCVLYFYNEIENSDTIDTQKVLLGNVMSALANHEAQINAENDKALKTKLEKRKIFPKKTQTVTKALKTKTAEREAFMKENKSVSKISPEAADKGNVYVQDSEKHYMQVEERD